MHRQESMMAFCGKHRISPGHTLGFMADLAFTQIKRVYTLHGATQSLGGEDGSHLGVSQTVNRSPPCWTRQSQKAKQP